MHVRRDVTLCIAIVCALASGCAHEWPTYPLPMTSAQLASYNTVPALAAYLRQRDASPSVCNLAGTTPHVGYLGEGARELYAQSLTETMLDPKVWAACSTQLLRTLRPEDANDLLDQIGLVVRDMLRKRDFETDRKQLIRAGHAWLVYTNRPTGLDGHAKVVDKLFKELRRAVDRHRLGILAAKMGSLLIGTYEMGHGLFEGKPVDVAMLDGLYAKHDEYTLRELMKRLPVASLRDEARRRLVRLHVAASTFAEVKANPAAVEDRLMREGRNPISLAQHPPTSGRIVKAPMRGVLVRQNWVQQVATLLGYGGDRPGLSVLPELSLVGVVMVDVGLSRAVTLCTSAEALDPSPCIDSREVRLANRAATIDAAGIFHFVEHIRMEDALEMAAMGHRFVLPVDIGEKRVAQFEWQLYYERPADMTLVADGAGGRGPNLVVAVDHHDPSRYVFGVSKRWYAVVEANDIGAFHVGTVGGDGLSGAPGYAGVSGSDGGECGSGSDGSNGGPGGSGGPGGNGGDATVLLSCGTVACPDAVRAVRALVYSAGGHGGAGGLGGPGGSGGRGGTGRSPTTHVDENGNTVTDDYGCTGGPAGRDGLPGSNGYDGQPGRPGRVTFQQLKN